MRYWYYLLVLTVMACTPNRKVENTQALADMQAMELEPGFEIQLVAAEPEVQDPVALAFDDDGSLWVVEMRGYMPSVSGLGEEIPNGRIKRLFDEDEDGYYESARVVIDSLVLPRAICPLDDGLLVAEPPCLWWYSKDGKSKALVDSAYASGGNVEHQANGLLKGMDHWIYSAKSNKRYQKKNGHWIWEYTVFRGQWGIDQGPHGHLVYNHNSAVLQADGWAPSTLPYSALHYPTALRQEFGASCISNNIFPSRATPGVNRAYQKGTLDSAGYLVNVTSACGPSWYGGGQFPDSLNGSAFSPEPAAYVVKRLKIQEGEYPVKATQAVAHTEFLRSKDERFRPVFSTTGPDGALYLVDMHRGLIQHSTYLTNYLRQYVTQNKLDQPTGMGRIYRIIHQQGKTVSWKNTWKQEAEWVNAFKHPNRWVRVHTQWKIASAGNVPLWISRLRAFIQRETDPVAVHHALWCLHALKGVDETVFNKITAIKHPALQESGMHIAAHYAVSGFQKLRKTDARRMEKVYAGNLPALAGIDSFATFLACQQFIKTNSGDSVLMALLSAGLWEHSSTAFRANLQRWNKTSKTSPLLDSWLNESPLYRESIPENLYHLSRAERDLYQEGVGLYKDLCAGCHGFSGEGIAALAPPLKGSEWVLSPQTEIPIQIVLHGLDGPLKVAGKSYEFPNGMPGIKDNQGINDGTIAKVLTFVRNSWGNKGSAVSTALVSKERAAPKKEVRHLMPLLAATPGNVLPREKNNRPSKSTVPPRIRLFNGKNLNGWNTKGGNAQYRIQQKSIQGISSLHTPNTFLVYQQAFANFILDLDVYVDTLLNSGIQVRSNAYTAYNNGVFHGYQIEIDPSSRAWSGGLYDESRRGWLQNVKDRPEAQAAFRKGQWNHYRIMAVDDHIRTWVNGIPVTDNHDPYTRSGYIGLQVHSIGGDSLKNGKTVQWKNISLQDLGGILWHPSSESKDNWLYQAYDGNPATYWEGQSLELECKKNCPHVLTLDAVTPAQLMQSQDGKTWTPVDWNGKRLKLSRWRYLRILPKAMNQPLQIREIRWE